MMKPIHSWLFSSTSRTQTEAFCEANISIIRLSEGQFKATTQGNRVINPFSAE